MTDHEHDDQFIDGWWVCNSCGRRERNKHADHVERLAAVRDAAREYLAAHPCDHELGCCYADDLNRALSYSLLKVDAR